MLSFEAVGFQTHKLLPLLCRPANLKQELISTGSEEHEHDSLSLLFFLTIQHRPTGVNLIKLLQV